MAAFELIKSGSIVQAKTTDYLGVNVSPNRLIPLQTIKDVRLSLSATKPDIIVIETTENEYHYDPTSDDMTITVDSSTDVYNGGDHDAVEMLAIFLSKKLFQEVNSTTTDGTVNVEDVVGLLDDEGIVQATLLPDIPDQADIDREIDDKAIIFDGFYIRPVQDPDFPSDPTKLIYQIVTTAIPTDGSLLPFNADGAADLDRRLKLLENASPEVIVPDAPIMTADDTANTETYTPVSPYTTADVEVSINDTSYIPWASVSGTSGNIHTIGDINATAGYWKYRIKASGTRSVSDPTPSAEFTATIPTTRRILLDLVGTGDVSGQDTTLSDGNYWNTIQIATIQSMNWGSSFVDIANSPVADFAITADKALSFGPGGGNYAAGTGGATIAISDSTLVDPVIYPVSAVKDMIRIQVETGVITLTFAIPTGWKIAKLKFWGSYTASSTKFIGARIAGVGSFVAKDFKNNTNFNFAHLFSNLAAPSASIELKNTNTSNAYGPINVIDITLEQV